MCIQCQSVSIENGGLRGGSVAGLQRKAKRFNSQARTKKAIISLLNGKDVFAVLPTGFGKSLIYQSFVFSKEIIHGHSPSVIVVIPLRSIVQEQLTSNEFNLKAVELSLQDDVLKNVSEGEVEVVYALAENVLNDKFFVDTTRLKLSVQATLEVDCCRRVT